MMTMKSPYPPSSFQPCLRRGLGGLLGGIRYVYGVLWGNTLVGYSWPDTMVSPSVVEINLTSLSSNSVKDVLL